MTLAACGGHLEIAIMLLERGSLIEEVNELGYRPLMEASKNGHKEMMGTRLSQGEDWTILDTRILTL